jgi:phosphatidylinositol kinase/protein kinase (PI-3  family)
VKDRHNGNIMLDSKGHLVHIDFGFMFQNSPGGINFEGAPFKLTQEYVDLMDGVESPMFEYFKSLLTKGFVEIRKHLDDIVVLINILMKDSRMTCFERPQFVL